MLVSSLFVILTFFSVSSTQLLKNIATIDGAVQKYTKVLIMENDSNNLLDIIYNTEQTINLILSYNISLSLNNKYKYKINNSVSIKLPSAPVSSATYLAHRKGYFLTGLSNQNYKFGSIAVISKADYSLSIIELSDWCPVSKILKTTQNGKHMVVGCSNNNIMIIDTTSTNNPLKWNMMKTPVINNENGEISNIFIGVNDIYAYITFKLGDSIKILNINTKRFMNDMSMTYDMVNEFTINNQQHFIMSNEEKLSMYKMQSGKLVSVFYNWKLWTTTNQISSINVVNDFKNKTQKYMLIIDNNYNINVYSINKQNKQIKFMETTKTNKIISSTSTFIFTLSNASSLDVYAIIMANKNEPNRSLIAST